MDEVVPVPTAVVSGSEVGNDQIVDIKPEVRDDFYYFQNLVFKVMSFSLYWICSLTICITTMNTEGGRYSVLRSTKCFRTAKWELLLGYVVLYPGSRRKWRADGGARRQAPHNIGRSFERTLSRLLARDVSLVSFSNRRLSERIGYIRCSSGAGNNTKYEDWVGVLHLATMWGFIEVCMMLLDIFWPFVESIPFRFEQSPSKLYRPRSKTNQLSRRSFSLKNITSRNGFSQAISPWCYRNGWTLTNFY